MEPPKKFAWDDLSDEDLALKQQLESCVKQTGKDCDPMLQKDALERMRQEILTSTSSMTSVPLPVKFLRPHYGTLKAYYETMAESDSKKILADVLSGLAFTASTKEDGESLKYRLLGSDVEIGSWGCEYVSNLVIEIRQEYEIRQSQEIRVEDLMELVHKIVAFYMKNNAEPDAVDLLIEVKNLDELVKHTDEANYERTCLYLSSLARYLNPRTVLYPAYLIYTDFGEHTNALRMTLYDRVQREYVRKIVKSCDDVLHKKQCCFVLARHGITFKLDNTMAADNEEREMLQGIINNSKLSEGYRTLARDLEVMEDKEHFLDGEITGGATFANAFVNAGFGQDKLITVPSSSGKWLFRTMEDGKTSVVASLGVIFLWDVDSGVEQIIKYVDYGDNHVRAGALLGIGILNCSIKHEGDSVACFHSAMGILPYTEVEDSSTRIGAIMGLGIAYAGSQNEFLRDKLEPILSDDKASEDVIVFTAISLGLIYVGSCNKEIAQEIISVLSYMSEYESENPLARLVPLAIGLLYLGKQNRMDIPSETLHEKIRDYADITLRSCAYAGTGDVLEVQYLLGHCSQHLDRSQPHHGPAVLGIAMIAMAEELGVDMAIRTLDHLLWCGDQDIRRVVPLALGLLCVSNPKVNVMNTLSILSHDTHPGIAAAAIISLGLIGAGTNNGQIARMLCDLSSCDYLDPFLLFWVRIAQGLLHMGKGLLALNPFHSDRFLLSPTALAGLIVVSHAFLDMSGIMFAKYHYVLYYLVLAMKPRMLMTVDENLKPLPVPVRVGKAVDVVAQAGRPRTITRFTTFSTTPVILAAGDRAELATEKYIPVSPILEGFVILKENPDYKEE